MLTSVKMNDAARGNIKQSVMEKINESQPHSIFFISDYADMGSAETIRKILHEATIKGGWKKPVMAYISSPRHPDSVMYPFHLKKWRKK